MSAPASPPSMAVRLGSAAMQDLVRLEEFLAASEDPLATQLLDFLLDGLAVLTHQPGIGRPLKSGVRELIISRGRSGYLARYWLDASAQTVWVLRIRHQRESGYAPHEV